MYAYLFSCAIVYVYIINTIHCSEVNIICGILNDIDSWEGYL